MTAPTSWTPEHDAMLRDNFEKGLPLSYEQLAADINHKFGTDYTRNSAIGRAHRIGLKAAKPPRGPKVVTERKARVTPVKRADVVLKRKAQLPPPKPFTPRVVDVRTENVTLIELAPDGCRWPSGEGPFVFCNHRQDGLGSYCAAHHRLSYGAPRARVNTAFHRSTR